MPHRMQCLQCPTACNATPPATSKMATRGPEMSNRVLKRVNLQIFGCSFQILLAILGWYSNNNLPKHKHLRIYLPHILWFSWGSVIVKLELWQQFWWNFLCAENVRIYLASNLHGAWYPRLFWKFCHISSIQYYCHLAVLSNGKNLSAGKIWWHYTHSKTA